MLVRMYVRYQLQVTNYLYMYVLYIYICIYVRAKQTFLVIGYQAPVRMFKTVISWLLQGGSKKPILFSAQKLPGTVHIRRPWARNN